MTKELAVLIGPDQPYLNTEAFMASLAHNLEAALTEVGAPGRRA